MTNPLLAAASLPLFDQIEPKHALPALTEVIGKSRETLAELEQIDQPTWASFAGVLEQLFEQIDCVWSPVSHLNAVQDSAELRTAYEQGLSELTAFYTQVEQSTALFARYKTLVASTEFESLSPARRKIARNALRDFVLGGAELTGEDKARFAEISERLSKLSNRFERNVLDATEAFSHHLDTADVLKGLPQSALSLAAEQAKQRGQTGYTFTLQFPSYFPVMQHAEDRALRETLYRAFSTRASDQSDTEGFDNAPVMDEILRLKREQANLLGYATYADVSMVTKMASSVDEVLNFLSELAERARPVAEAELNELTEFAKSLGHEGPLEAWDMSFYAERLRESRFSFTAEEVKQYFPASAVLEGMFEIVRRLLGVRVEADPGIAVWHPDVTYYSLLNASGDVVGGFYTDLYARDKKRSGAWMGTCRHRVRRAHDGELQTPVAFLTCNFTPPTGGAPALLTHDEVETLFHEFGHTLHHLLTEVEEYSVAGINGVAWDAVELPSQWLENWCWEPEGLAMISSHIETGDTIPESLIAKLRAAKQFQSGLQTLRQVEFALFDLKLHASTDASPSVMAVLESVRAKVSVTTPPAYNRFANSFSHIFAGGYAAGYYSYKWAEVLSADAFDAFAEAGLFDQSVGERFRSTILAQGGVVDAAELFKQFRGREPQIEPLLKHSGLLQNAS